MMFLTWAKCSNKAPNLSQGDVATVGQRRDTQSLNNTKVLVVVLEVNRGDADTDVLLLFAPVEPSLLEPLKVVGGSDALFIESLNNVTLVHLKGVKCELWTQSNHIG